MVYIKKLLVSVILLFNVCRSESLEIVIPFNLILRKPELDTKYKKNDVQNVIINGAISLKRRH